MREPRNVSVALAAVAPWVEAALDGLRAHVFVPPGKRRSKAAQVAQPAEKIGNNREPESSSAMSSFSFSRRSYP